MFDLAVLFIGMANFIHWQTRAKCFGLLPWRVKHWLGIKESLYTVRIVEKLECIISGQHLRYPSHCSKGELNMTLNVVVGLRMPAYRVIGSLAWKVNSSNMTLADFSTFYWTPAKFISISLATWFSDEFSKKINLWNSCFNRWVSERYWVLSMCGKKDACEYSRGDY